MKTSPNKSLRGIFLGIVYLVGILGIVASGGGGGSASISYAGNTDPAVISRTNAARLVGNIFIGRTIVGSGSGGAARIDTSIDTSSRGIGLAQIPGRLTRKLRNAMQSSPDFVSRSTTVRARTDVDETEPCDNNDGSIRITGFIEDNGTGTLTLDFINCRDGNEILDGKITVRVNAFDFGFFLPTDAVYSFTVLSLSSSTYSASIDGSVHSQISLSTQTEQLTVDRLVARNNATGEMIMIANQVSVVVFDSIFAPSSLSETITGRIYDSTHGYVDFATIAPIIFSSITQDYPDGGQVLLTGSLNSAIRVIVISDTHSLLDLDLDGDSAFEIAVTLSWTELETEPDLADSDGDGMHDSWEQANGLGPNDPGDAGGDLDGDSFTNLEEYRYGSNPNNAGSTPAAADLSITKTTTMSAVGVGENFTYTVTVNHGGGVTATGVVVTDVLPVSMTLLSATSSQGNCTQGATVTCNLGSLQQFQSTAITIEVTPTQQGTFVNTANVASLTPDAITANNSANASMSVGTPATGIQSLIDGASNGDTVMVAPGTYIGTIDFKGKAITLVSMNGPLLTVLDGGGANSPVVNFSSGEGNNSVLDGFTIQNGGDRGINVSSASPIIQNNIIAQNTACAGAGIELGFSSAVVRQNIIRNNFKSGCSGGTGGGGILIRGAGSAMVVGNQITSNSSSDGGGISMFAAGTPTIQGNTINGNSGGAISMVNTSDAFIVNNVIANNTDGDCGGIDWLVPSGANGPRVINNTFFDNDGNNASAICADGFDIQAEIINNTIVAKSGQTAIFCGNFNDLNPPVIMFNNVLAPSGISYGGICTDQTGLNGNISADPLFVDSANEDFRLGMASPSIDAGDKSVIGLPSTDILGNARIIDGDSNGTADIDLGAHEYTP
ncbi:MAG: right-handed parallel beta-helix repeat-containing protein [Gammaproteobacteria bacterium]|nr:right-handed parallel beta-helix repeat-containing protein [Gammaproteobacteria bacterium]